MITIIFCYCQVKIKNNKRRLKNTIIIMRGIMENMNFEDSIKEIEHIDSLLNVISLNIPGIWYKENEPFVLKNIGFSKANFINKKPVTNESK